jgi:hypothetical protein
MACPNKVSLVDVSLLGYNIIRSLFTYSTSSRIADQSRHEYILTDHAKKGQTFSFYIEAACNGMFGVGSNDAMVPDPNRYFSIKKADLVVPDSPLQHLYHDLT